MATEVITAKIKPTDKPKRHRSPNYPAAGLKESVERTAAYMTKNNMAATLPESAVKGIGFSSGHGSAMSVLAALKKFGLMEEKNGRVGPTQRAAEIINLPKTDERRLRAIKDAALMPPLYRELIEQYRDTGIPQDDGLIGELTTYKGFSTNAAKEFLKAFRETLDFAGLSDVSVLGSESEAEGEPKKQVKVGDYIQWTSQGSDQFIEPKRVRWICEDGSHLSVDGSTNGIPTAQVTVVEAPAPPNPPVGNQQREREIPRGSGSADVKQAVYPLPDGGEVILSWPTSISEDSLEDVRDWLKIVDRTITKFIAKRDEPKPTRMSFNPDTSIKDERPE